MDLLAKRLPQEFEFSARSVLPFSGPCCLEGPLAMARAK